MGRKPAINEEEFNTIKTTIADVQRKSKETLEHYVSRLNRYSGIRQISDKSLSRIMRSGTYEDFMAIVKKDNRKKQNQSDPVKPDDAISLLKRLEERLAKIEARISKIEEKLDQSEVKILAVANEDKLTRWDTLHKEIKDNKIKEACNQ